MERDQVTKVIEWLSDTITEAKELLVFVLIVVLGTAAKIVVAMRKGTKFTTAWLISELIMSFFVAITVYSVLHQFLELNELFCFTICAWCGTFSTAFHERLRDFMEFIFDTLKTWIKIRAK